MPAHLNQQLYDALTELNAVPQDVLDRAFQASQTNHRPLEDLLVSENAVSDKNLGRVMADLLGLPFIRLTETPIDQQLVKLVTPIFAKENRLVPYRHDQQGIYIATANPDDLRSLDFIRKRTNQPLVLAYATPGDISDALTKFGHGSAQSFTNQIKQLSEQAETAESESDPPIIKMVDLILDHSYQRKASDVHMEPEEDEALIRFRVDGQLHDIVRIPKKIYFQMVTRLKVMSNLRTDEHQAPQDGKIRHKVEGEKLDLRVSILPVINGEKIVMRLLSERSRQLSLPDLGLTSHNLAKVTRAYSKPHGMILVTGPTGSGKTTSLYAILKLLNKREVNIMTIEDPVEYDITGINQIQVNPKTSLTFATGLRSIVRQDPDIILVGEVRDEETAGIAVNSAMTGHLVLSSLHTNDAATAMPRLIDMAVEPFLVASSINIVVAQRLIRKLCNHCRFSKEIKLTEIMASHQAKQGLAGQQGHQSARQGNSQPHPDDHRAGPPAGARPSQTPSPPLPPAQPAQSAQPAQLAQAAQSTQPALPAQTAPAAAPPAPLAAAAAPAPPAKPKIELSPELIRKHFGHNQTIRVYQGKGCDICHHSGYIGRIGIFEVLEITDQIKEAIVASQNASQIQKLAYQQGMTSMLDDGLEKIKAGITTIEELMRVVME
ncbi:MAG: type II secretion system protein GspE [Candidatus Pacebacteria bacterium CG10_big_fil_rev_8_21_14_0_10_56_10]|nr:MAG: type II secretion system protein GspE [Candidatus Pacebacteria bacterium CG10_big_fil_rev_8_21_14_0_10_56_10]